MNIYGWDSKTTSHLALSKLRGAAEVWYRGLPSHLFTWEQWREMILNNFQKNSILSIKNGNDNVRIEDNCLEEELATTPILSEIRTLSLTFVMLMRFFARLNIYYKTFLTRMQCYTTPFTSCCHNVDFCIAFLRQSANNYRHCSFCGQISPVVLKNKQ
jgi:hypothetical protein